MSRLAPDDKKRVFVEGLKTHGPEPEGGVFDLHLACVLDDEGTACKRQRR